MTNEFKRISAKIKNEERQRSETSHAETMRDVGTVLAAIVVFVTGLIIGALLCNARSS